MKKILAVICSITFILVMIQACTKDKAETNVDKILFSEATAGGFTYYRNGDLLPGAPPSPHGSFRLRFNSMALSVLDSTGELPQGRDFPKGSLIVKEVHSGGALSIYSIMKKDPSNSNAGNGWIWAEIEVDGATVFSSAKKGEGCIGCHSESPNRDFTRTFDLH